MIKYNHLNHIASEWFIVWTHLGGRGVFEDGSVESSCMGGSVESDHRDKSDINKTAGC